MKTYLDGLEMSHSTIKTMNALFQNSNFIQSKPISLVNVSSPCLKSNKKPGIKDQDFKFLLEQQEYEVRVVGQDGGCFRL